MSTIEFSMMKRYKVQSLLHPKDFETEHVICRGTKETSFEETYKGHILVINTTTINNRSDLNRPLVSLPLGRAIASSNTSAGRRNAEQNFAVEICRGEASGWQRLLSCR